MTVRFRKLVPKNIYFELAKDPAISKIEVQPCRNKRLRNPHLVDCQIFVAMSKDYMIGIAKRSRELLNTIPNSNENLLAKWSGALTSGSVSYKTYKTLYNFNKEHKLGISFGKKISKKLQEWDDKSYLDPSLKWEETV